jgi:hypothetical protein
MQHGRAGIAETPGLSACPPLYVSGPHAFQDCFTWEEYQHQYHSGLTLPMYEAFHGLQLPSVKELIRQLHVPGPDELRHILAQEVI